MSKTYSFTAYSPHKIVRTGEKVHVICVNDIRKIATGQKSIAEFDDPESMAMALAKMPWNRS